MALSNFYSLRTAKDKRSCFICGKMSSAVLDAPDDFFFVCLSHLNDSGFCTSLVGPAVSQTENNESSEKLKKDINDSKAQKDKESTDNLESMESKNNSSEVVKIDGPKNYKLHRSILYLREQEKSKKEKLNLLKSLK